MRKCILFFLFILLAAGFLCCSGKAEEDKVLAKINDYELTLKDFQYQILDDVDLSEDFKKTKEGKREFLEYLIRREMLIQEARRQGLDRKDKFIRAIERYWEATLIRDLMDMKGEALHRETSISQKEIEARYLDLKKADKDLLPLKEVRDEIARELVEKKRQWLLKQWINKLRKNAKIEIDQELLYGN